MILPKKRRNRRLIPRFDLQGYHIEQTNTLNQYGRLEQDVPTLTAFNVKMCTLHSAKSRDLQTLPEGLRDNNIVILTTDSELITSEEGSDDFGDMIRVPDTINSNSFKTFVVFRVDKSYNNVIISNKAYCVEYDPEMSPVNLSTTSFIVDETTRTGGDESWWQYWVDPDV